MATDTGRTSRAGAGRSSRSQRSSWSRIAWSVGMLLAGLCVLLASVVWPYLIPVHAVWDANQAKQYREAAVKLHALTGAAAEAKLRQEGAAGHGRAPPGAPQRSPETGPHRHPVQGDPSAIGRDLAAAQARFEQAKAALQNARRIRHSARIGLSILGGALIVAGLAVKLTGQ